MKHSIKGLFVILAVVVSFVLVQGVWAETETNSVTGFIVEISEKPNMIMVDETEIYGVRFNYLCNQYNICLEEGDTVNIEYYVFECSNGDVKNMASSITVGDATIILRETP